MIIGGAGWDFFAYKDSTPVQMCSGVEDSSPT